MPKRTLRINGSAVAVVLTLGAVAACGGTTKKTASASTGPTAAATVPAPAPAAGTLVVAADATYAPNEFIGPDGHTVVGMDADLVKALGQAMGRKVNLVNANFASIIPGLGAHKYDIGASSFTDTKEREKTVDFVTYFAAGTAFYTHVQGGAAVGTLAALCGHVVAVESGTTQQIDATAEDKKCRAAGKSGVNVRVFPDQNAANLALSSGRAQVGMADSPVAAYAVKKSGGAFKLVGAPYGTAPYGLALAKGSGLAQRVLAAVKKLIADGTYKTILDRWGVGTGAIANPTINGATS